MTINTDFDNTFVDQIPNLNGTNRTMNVDSNGIATFPTAPKAPSLPKRPMLPSDQVQMEAAKQATSDKAQTLAHKQMLQATAGHHGATPGGLGGVLKGLGDQYNNRYQQELMMKAQNVQAAKMEEANNTIGANAPVVTPPQQNQPQQTPDVISGAGANMPMQQQPPQQAPNVLQQAFAAQSNPATNTGLSFAPDAPVAPMAISPIDESLPTTASQGLYGSQ